MSFPRAKIKRFNDIPAITPSPAEYNVNLQQKPKFFLPQSERFTEPKSPPASENGSTQSTPCFRTPTLIKKKKLLGSASKLKFLSGKISDKELLNERTVECKNKDAFIKELTEQFDELKNHVFNLNCEKENLIKEKKQFEDKIVKIQIQYDSKITDLTKEHKTEISKLDTEIAKINEERSDLHNKNIDLKKTLNELKENKKHEIELYNKEIDAKNRKIEDLENNLKQIEEKKTQIEQNHELELKEICTKHAEELENVQFEMLKCVHDLQKSLDEEKRQNELKIDNLQKCFENEIKNIKQSHNSQKELTKSENAARIKQLEENMSEIKVLSEIQAKEKLSEVENYWKGELEKQIQESAAILKECQAISEYNIIQTEIEKNDFKSKLDLKTAQYKDLEKKYDTIYYNYKQLQGSYSNVQNKLYRLIKELKQKESIATEIDKLIIEKQTYEATILRSQKTIDILKRRLTESDMDVEQLKNEISENEKKILEYEDKLNTLSNELEEAQTLNEESEMHNQSIIKMTQKDIENIQKDLLERIEKFRVESEECQKMYREELDKKENEKEELLKFIKDQQMLHDNAREVINRADVELEKLVTENTDYYEQIEILKNENIKLQTDLDNLNDQKEHWVIDKKELDLKIDILKNELKQWRQLQEDIKSSMNRIAYLENICEKLDRENAEKNSRIQELNKELMDAKEKSANFEKIKAGYIKTIEEQNALIAPFKEQLEGYELEMNNLQCAKEYMENEAKDLSNKYAQILGHQNHKQKIKYMVNLKTKNDELLKSNMDLEGKIRAMDKKMEKLKRENMDLKRNSRKPSVFEDKENIASPNRSFKCESPGPLRELN